MHHFFDWNISVVTLIQSLGSQETDCWVNEDEQRMSDQEEQVSTTNLLQS